MECPDGTHQMTANQCTYLATHNTHTGLLSQNIIQTEAIFIKMPVVVTSRCNLGEIPWVSPSQTRKGEDI